MIVYCVTNQINGKVYIGQTINSLQKRKSGHFTSSKKASNNFFHNALRKYGEDDFDWEVLRECNTIDALNKLEQYYISIFDSMNSGYNLTSGGLNCLISDATRKKMAENCPDFSGKNNPMYGKRGKDNPNFGRKHPPEEIEKMSGKRPHHSGKNSHRYGVRHTPKLKAMFSQKAIERWKDPIYREKVLKAKGIL